MFERFRKLVRRINILGVEVEFHPPTEGSDDRLPQVHPSVGELNSENLDCLHVSAFPLDDFEAHDIHEDHKGALGIFVSNVGTFNITIIKAYFLPGRDLPVYPLALRSSEPGTFEIKFGDQWREPTVKLQAGARTLTYMPLAKPVPKKLVENQKCGLLYLKCKARGKSGLHVVRL